MKLYNVFKKISFLLIALLCLFFLNNNTAKAEIKEFNVEENLIISENEIINNDVYVISQDLIVNGSISGDLIAVSNNITINGEIAGDLIAVSNNIEVNGIINGNLRTISENLIIKGTVQKNISTISINLDTENTSFIGWNVLSLSDKISLNGQINGNVNLFSNDLDINSIIEKNLKVNILNKEGYLTLGNKTIINGELFYKNFSENIIKIDGQVIEEINSELKKSHDFFVLPWFIKKLFLIFSAILLALLLTTFIKNIDKKFEIKDTKHFLNIFLQGSILFFITPILSILLMFSFIGIPLSLILLSLYIILIYLAKIITAFFLGNIILTKLFKIKEHKKIWSGVLGIVLLWFSFSIPYFGKIISFITIIIGSGLIINYVKNKSKNI